MNKFFIILLIFTYSSLAKAEQNVAEYLNSTHITIMDFGLSNIAENFRLYTLINSKGYSVSPYWEKEEGFVLRIISDYKYNEKIHDQKIALEICNKAISDVRRVLGVNPDTGKPEDGIVSHFGASFDSYGSSYGESAIAHRKENDKLVTIKGFIDFAKDGNFAKCESKLVE